MDIITYPGSTLSAGLANDGSLGMRPTNERHCYNVTPSLIGLART